MGLKPLNETRGGTTRVQNYPAGQRTDFFLSMTAPALAQVPPSAQDYEGYSGFFKAVHDGELDAVRAALREGIDLEQSDNRQRTALHIAAYRSHDRIFRLLAEAGADLNAMEFMAYDVITIAPVADDIGILELAIEYGGNVTNITSPYDGTALIAAARLGHAELVRKLLEAGAPPDHVNNLGWTALMEAVVLGDGSAPYLLTVRHLLAHGADREISDNQGLTPLEHSRQRGFSAIVDVLSG